ncbi:MAG: DUF1588 domain-containing protein [Planctomycetota bacterium]
MRKRLVTLVILALSSVTVAGANETASFESLVGPFLKTHCIDCHGPDGEGDVELHEVSGVTSENVELWKQVWEQVALGEMPPKDIDERPTPLQRAELSNWITASIVHASRSIGGFDAHRHPSKGNHLDHSLLFGEIPAGLEPSSTPARLWRIHPQEHLTRLSALINDEPAFDPKHPGMRTRGDQIQPNQDGEIKVYFGLDRVIGWVGGTAAYAAAITGFPPALSTHDDHGLRSYPIYHSVNSAEATQIASVAEDILRFMAFGPDAEPYQFADKVGDIDSQYKHESLRGLSQSLFYAKEPKRPLTPVYELMRQPGYDREQVRAAVDFLFEALTCRPPTPAETDKYVSIVDEAVADLGKEDGLILGLSPIFLDREALFRTELAETGTPDEFGRVMLQDEELGLAINAALSYLPPDATLKSSMTSGGLRSREDARREIVRLLNDDSVRKPRLLQFFQEYFDYDRAGGVCKDVNALRAAGGQTKDQNHYRAMFAMKASSDRLIERILEEDKNVLRELLTTNRAVVSRGQDAAYFGEYLSDKRPPVDPKAKRNAVRRLVTIREAKFPKGEAIHVRIARVIRGNRSKRELTTLSNDERMGILTHPSWLVSHSDAMDNHAIHRGKWIRERLLGGAVPDVPITVDAMLPDEPGETLRHRMRVTREEYCWKCHQKMDPLGLPFEMYNHLGLYRKVEHAKPVDTRGEIIDSGDPELDGPVEDALELIERLAKSDRVTQVFVRHAFRFWIGRNETLQDAPVLQAAYKAYQDNEGSMKALLESLLTSDAFLYRKRERADVGSLQAATPSNRPANSNPK